ncbi:MAG: Uma2 family endonuclease [Bryobacteraceae bacterium]|jgi:Uma2 family endonuclease
MAVSTLVPVEEYLSSVYEPDCDYVDGEVIERNMGESDHSGLQLEIALWLASRRRKTAIQVYPELRVQVAPRRYRVPDIAVTTHKIPRGVLREPPFLCVEILSPEDRMSRVDARIDDFLAFGVKYVWLVDPRRRKAWIYTSEGRREAAAVLTTSSPDLALPLEEIFIALDEDIEADVE